MSLSNQIRITASSLLLSLKRNEFVSERRFRMSEDSTKLSTILHWISIVISPHTAVALSHDASSSSFTVYLCSNSFRDIAMKNASRLLHILRKSLSIAWAEGNQFDLEEEYLTFVTDACWDQLQGKVNNKVPRFPLVPDGADVSTIPLLLKTLTGLVDTWKAWRVRSGLTDEDSRKITEMKQELNHLHSSDTLKHCFEQVFHPLDDTSDHLKQLRRLWRCCHALMTSNFFADVFNENWATYHTTRFLHRVYRRIWRLYSYRKGIDVLLDHGISYLVSIAREYRSDPPEISVYLLSGDFPSTIQMAVAPDRFIFEAGQRCGRRSDLTHKSRFMSQARSLWSANETKTVNVHPMVTLANFLYSSGTAVMEKRIGSSRRPCVLCHYYTRRIPLKDFNWQTTQPSTTFRVDWALPQGLSQTLTRKKAEMISAEITNHVERRACEFSNDMEESQCLKPFRYWDPA